MGVPSGMWEVEGFKKLDINFFTLAKLGSLTMIVTDATTSYTVEGMKPATMCDLTEKLSSQKCAPPLASEATLVMNELRYSKTKY
ncbi:hypothetical protein EVAR_88517_1 [Eumeta japonica]|uniref:Uncharacterized protein n=1 Tax=Eumeta variegata TaxID=151549 RepID=A0A4C1WNX4_EUMVA|nr:hypothetical protein EVAR_88517_1 [Eumeta japonica]